MQKVRYLSLGGAGNVTRNMHVFETERDIIIVDAGIGFPDTEQLGVDVVIPDVSYLASRQHKIRALLITHAHEDHIGAIQYIIKDIGRPPIYAAKLAKAFIEAKLTEAGISNQTIIEIVPEKAPINLGDFTITPYRVNHSVPDALGFFIGTPAGNIVFSPDFKFDWTPVDNVLFQVGKLAHLCEQGVLALFSDSLGSTREGYTESERSIQEVFEKYLADARGQVFITTMSSNISRMQQAINASVKFSRRIVPVGRSIEQNLLIAQNLGYIDAPKDTIVPLDQARRVPPHKATYIIAGSFGQKGSALDRLARGENRQLRLRDNALVIFSADPIPGVVAGQVSTVIDNLMKRNAHVVYSEIQDNLHVSGHGSQGDLSMMAGIVRPRYFVPMGGEVRHLRGYRDLMERMGFDPTTVFELTAGQTVDFTPEQAKLGEVVEMRDIYVDGGLVGDVGTIVLKERMQLAAEGVVVIVVKKQGNKLLPMVTLDSRGFVFKAGSDDIIRAAAKEARVVIGRREVSEWARVKEELERRIGGYIYQKIKRRPLILSVLIDLATDGQSDRR